jgi:hypothetical protein
MVEQGPRRRSTIQLHFVGFCIEKRPLKLLFEPNSSNGRVRYSGRSEAEPGTERPSASGSRTGRIASPLPQMMRVE